MLITLGYDIGLSAKNIQNAEYPARRSRVMPEARFFLNMREGCQQIVGTNLPH